MYQETEIVIEKDDVNPPTPCGGSVVPSSTDGGVVSSVSPPPGDVSDEEKEIKDVYGDILKPPEDDLVDTSGKSTSFGSKRVSESVDCGPTVIDKFGMPVECDDEGIAKNGGGTDCGPTVIDVYGMPVECEDGGKGGSGTHDEYYDDYNDHGGMGHGATYGVETSFYYGHHGDYGYDGFGTHHGDQYGFEYGHEDEYSLEYITAS